jgi:hypothetical protein
MTKDFSLLLINRVLIFAGVLWLVSGCTSKTDQDVVDLVPTPTVHSVFSTLDTLDQSESDSYPTLERPTLTPLPTLTPRPPLETRIVTIYDDALHSDWSVNNSREVDYLLQDTTFSYNGENSLSYAPKVEYADLAFTVNEDSDAVYLRDDVLAVRFWLYSGDDYLENDDLAVSVVGSNAFPYWVADDDSVTVQDDLDVFPVTRLYYLDVDRDIPPDTWIQIELWLNEHEIYEPEYKYVTGIYIKNDEDFFRTIYLDDVELVIREN